MTRVNLFVVFAVVVAVSVCPMLMSAREYAVGDEEGWNTDVDYYEWVANKTFYVGDALVFNYSEEHNVIIVNSTGYDECISSPNLGALYSGHDKVTLKTPGNNYYICQWHCDYSDQKLNVTVLPKKTLGGAKLFHSPYLPDIWTIVWCCISVMVPLIIWKKSLSKELHVCIH